MHDFDDAYSPGSPENRSIARDEFAPPPDVIPVEAKKLGHPVVAWIAIVALVCLMFIVRIVISKMETPGEEAAHAKDSSLVVIGLQAKYVLGLARFAPSGKEIYASLQALNTGSLDQRLAFVTLAGELEGPEEARTQLDKLRDKLEEHKKKLADSNEKPTAEQERVIDILDNLYQDYGNGDLKASSVSAKDRALLQEELGWFGKLALAPAKGPDQAARQEILDSATRAFIAIIAGVILVLPLGIGGLVGLVLFLIFLFSGRLRTGVHPVGAHGGVYAESFALYLFLFSALNFGSLLIPSAKEWLLAVNMGAAILSLLLALAWPVLRGVSWKQVREDVGFNLGRQPVLEPAIGVGGYAMTLPLLAVGVLIMFVLLMLVGGFQQLLGNAPDEFAPKTAPTAHPIVFVLLQSDWWTRLQIYILACIVAPLVEETMFRGVLYSHLREATAKFGFFLSMLFSCLGVSFIFAVIHPQGLLAVPVLMALALGFNLVREWRGTVLPGMVAHGLNNGLVITLAIMLLGD